MKLLKSIVLGAMLTSVIAPVAFAQSVEEFYKGKTVTIYVGFGPGGGYDLYARLVADSLGKKIPGNPTVIVENMPGAGGRIAAQYLYNIAPKDGTALSVPVQSIALDSLLNVLPGNVDASKYTAIGRMSTEYELGMVWQDVEANALDKIKDVEVTFASTGAGSASTFVPMMLNEMIGTKFKVIQGYEGANAAMHALETGEVDAAMQGLAGMTTSKPDWIPTGKVTPVWQLGLTRHELLPDVPAVGELGDNDLDREALRIVAGAAEIGRSLISTPDVPADRAEALRKAFTEMIEDPEFIAEAAKRRQMLQPLTGEQLQAVLQEQMVVSPEALERVKPFVVAQ